MSIPDLGVPGPATEDEIRKLYPPMYTYAQLKGFILSGLVSAGILASLNDIRTSLHDMLPGVTPSSVNMALSVVRPRYFKVKYLVEVRLGWGDGEGIAKPTFASSTSTTPNPLIFRADLPEEYVKVIPNDWPYSVPLDVSHFVVWSRVPVISSANIPLIVQGRVKEEGLWGFTGADGSEEPVPAAGENPRTPVSDEEEKLLEEARHEFHVFVKNRWPEDDWECAWFVNPPKLQSVPGLAHIHVFARRK